MVNLWICIVAIVIMWTRSRNITIFKKCKGTAASLLLPYTCWVRKYGMNQVDIEEYMKKAKFSSALLKIINKGEVSQCHHKICCNLLYVGHNFWSSIQALKFTSKLLKGCYAYANEWILYLLSVLCCKGQRSNHQT